MKINISYGATKDWLNYTRISIASVLMKANPNDEYHFFIVCNDYDENDKKSFTTLNKIKEATYEFINIDPNLFKGEIRNERGVSTFYRIFLAEMLPNEDKVLYLDTDTIANSDVAELYKFDITDYYVAGVEDKHEHEMRRLINLPEGQYFINGGVLLMNLAAFRRDNLREKLYDNLKATNFFCDQTSINDVCRGKILQLPLKYNLMIEPNEFLNLFNVYLRRNDEYLASRENSVIHHLMFHPWDEGNDFYSINQEWFRIKEYLEIIDNEV